jgi:hypothetical protein
MTWPPHQINHRQTAKQLHSTLGPETTHRAHFDQAAIDTEAADGTVAGVATLRTITPFGHAFCCLRSRP